MKKKRERANSSRVKIPHWSAAVIVGMLKEGNVLHLETGNLGMDVYILNKWHFSIGIVPITLPCFPQE